jgi:Xaa-Pro dipeptidase
VDEAARKVIREGGRDRQFMHITGHGLGYRYHEYAPMIAPGSRDVLQVGMIHSVEPGIYDPAFGGIRIEDDVLVTEGGAEVLAPISSELSG